MRLRWLGATVLVALALGGAFVGQAITAGPGGWDHVGDAGTPGTKSLNGNVTALSVDAPGLLLVGGYFTDAGGNASADHIASWNGSSWSPVGSASDQLNGTVLAITQANGKVYAGGSFTDAGGNTNADFLAVWDGQAWQPFCTSTAPGQPSFNGNVDALQVVGSTLYVGGQFQNGAGILNADYLLACNLGDGASSATFTDQAQFFSGPVLALAASGATLYAAGRFDNLAGIPQADNVAYLSGGAWHAMGSGPAACQCAVDDFARALTVLGTDVYVGTDAKDVAGIQQADTVARWNGSSWSAAGSNTAGDDGWFPASAFIYGMTAAGGSVYATGTFQDAGGDPTADNVARFDGDAWHAVGSNGAGNGPWSGDGLALAVFGGKLYAGGGFTSAGGDTQARGIASFDLGGATPVATPTPTPAPTPGPTPVATPTPTPDTTAPTITKLSLSSTTFRAAPSGAPYVHVARAPVGTIVSFRLSEPGAVRFTVDRCRRRAGSTRCRWVTVKGSFRVAGKRGVNRIKFRGRIGGRALKPGSYRLNARETDRAANRSRTKRTAFAIVR